MLNIYTDGSCIKTFGGWAVYIKEYDKFISGSVMNTTNNRMELIAVIEAIKYTEKYYSNDYFKIYSDSLLTINCASGIWKRNANIDLWTEYDSVAKNKNIIFEWIKGHSGNIHNESVDKLAKECSKRIYK